MLINKTDWTNQSFWVCISTLEVPTANGQLKTSETRMNGRARVIRTEKHCARNESEDVVSESIDDALW